MLQMKSAKDLVDYLKHFRADSIVNDAEFIRVCLDPDAKPWTVLGQVLRLLFYCFTLCIELRVLVEFVIFNHS